VIGLSPYLLGSLHVALKRGTASAEAILKRYNSYNRTHLPVDQLFRLVPCGALAPRRYVSLGAIVRYFEHFVKVPCRQFSPRGEREFILWWSKMMDGVYGWEYVRLGDQRGL
jgi:hypothetical protein